MKLHSHKLMLLALIGLTLLSISTQPVKCDGNDLLEDQLAQPEPKKQQQQPSFLQRFKLPKMFDFEEYKKLFKRTYHGLEEMVRRKLMLARALRAWISSLKYKYRQSSFYLAVNEFSDQTPEELQRMVNHHIVVVDENHEEPPHQVIFNTNQPSIPEVDSNHIEEELDHLTSENLIKDDVESLEKLEDELKRIVHDRKKRHISQGRKTGSKGSTEKSPAGTQVLSNLTLYSVGMDKESDEDLHSFIERHSRPQFKKEDEVFFDHRASNCMFVPRRQRQCGSCYAFATITIAEWTYCKLTGKQVAFSEQYIIDCGSPHLVNGCKGGSVLRAAEFIHNYGLELNSKYPYMMRENTCPYGKQTDHKAMGHIRMDLTSFTIVPVQMFHKVIKYTPLYVEVGVGHDFQQYGGGVMDGYSCRVENLHAVVLIGHGREDGREYWIFRNSFGPQWGEKGHYRLNKESECISHGRGYVLGTHDLVNFDSEPKLNPLNDPSKVEAHVKMMMNEL